MIWRKGSFPTFSQTLPSTVSALLVWHTHPHQRSYSSPHHPLLSNLPPTYLFHVATPAANVGLGQEVHAPGSDVAVNVAGLCIGLAGRRHIAVAARLFLERGSPRGRGREGGQLEATCLHGDRLVRLLGGGRHFGRGLGHDDGKAPCLGRPSRTGRDEDDDAPASVGVVGRMYVRDRG